MIDWSTVALFIIAAACVGRFAQEGTAAIAGASSVIVWLCLVAAVIIAGCLVLA